MHKKRSIVGGLIMILIGVVFLVLNMFPSVAERLDMARLWPLVIVAVGVFFLLASLVTAADLAIPGSIMTGIGSILYYQNATGNWASWAYAWALIPGFVGVGMLISSLLSGEENVTQRSDGLRLLVISVLLFAVFGLFFNGLGRWGEYWPILLIVAGIWLLFRNRVR